jgi:site-specific DNA-methyltransferase (adenine-specific)
MELNKIYKGDARELLKGLGDKSIDVCLTDFPYGIGENYGEYKDTKENLIELVNDIVPELVRVCNVVAFTAPIKHLMIFPQPKWILCWAISGAGGMSSWGFNCWQPILVYGDDPYLKNRMGSRPDLIYLNETSEKNGHPCPKPITLWRKVLDRISVKETDIILDPFIGSGTTAIACMEAKKQWIGFEMEQSYIDIANKRIDLLLSQPKLF